MYKKNIKPPYLLGILCLIPLIGAFVGLGLILYGIIKYKDKWLVLIGSGGIIISAIIYAFLFYDLKYGKNTAEGFAEISQIELNTLVKNIEFYKMQNGAYPDSLEQLTKNDKMVIIYDPLLTRKLDNNLKTTYEYQKTGANYRVFSVGIDGIPNTNDDIYPSISESNTSKFGFAKKREVDVEDSSK